MEVRVTEYRLTLDFRYEQEKKTLYAEFEIKLDNERKRIMKELEYEISILKANM